MKHTPKKPLVLYFQTKIGEKIEIDITKKDAKPLQITCGDESYISNEEIEYECFTPKLSSDGSYVVKVWGDLDLRFAFQNISLLNNLIKVETGDFIFTHPDSFNGCINLREFHVTGMAIMTNIKGMFCGCASLDYIDLRGVFFTDDVNSTEFMFSYCENLRKVEFPRSSFGENIHNMNRMFLDCPKLEHVNMRRFRPSEEVLMESLLDTKAMCGQITVSHSVKERYFQDSDIFCTSDTTNIWLESLSDVA
jgi:hypothetical protein